MFNGFRSIRVGRSVHSTDRETQEGSGVQRRIGTRLILAAALIGGGIVATVPFASPAFASGSWSSAHNVDSTNKLSSVSCPTASFCAAVDQQGNTLTYNGTSWSAPTNVDSSPMDSVSCPTPSFCTALDFSGRALTYNGGWSSSQRRHRQQRPGFGVLRDGQLLRRRGHPRERAHLQRQLVSSDQCR